MELGRDKEFRNLGSKRKCFNVGHYSLPGSKVGIGRQIDRIDK